MKLLERLKKIIHFNIQTEEINQSQDISGIKKNEPCEINKEVWVKEGKNSEGKNSEGKNLEEKNTEQRKTEGKNLEEKNTEQRKTEGKDLEEKNTEERYSERENLEELNSDSPQDIEVEYEIVEKEILPEKIICPDCGGVTLEGLDFCDKCGGELYIYNR